MFVFYFLHRLQRWRDSNPRLWDDGARILPLHYRRWPNVQREACKKNTTENLFKMTEAKFSGIKNAFQFCIFTVSKKRNFFFLAEMKTFFLLVLLLRCKFGTCPFVEKDIGQPKILVQDTFCNLIKVKF